MRWRRRKQPPIVCAMRTQLDWQGECDGDVQRYVRPSRRITDANVILDLCEQHALLLEVEDLGFEMMR